MPPFKVNHGAFKPPPVQKAATHNPSTKTPLSGPATASWLKEGREGAESREQNAREINSESKSTPRPTMQVSESGTDTHSSGGNPYFLSRGQGKEKSSSGDAVSLGEMLVPSVSFKKEFLWKGQVRAEPVRPESFMDLTKIFLGAYFPHFCLVALLN